MTSKYVQIQIYDLYSVFQIKLLYCHENVDLTIQYSHAKYDSVK